MARPNKEDPLKISWLAVSSAAVLLAGLAFLAAPRSASAEPECNSNNNGVYRTRQTGDWNGATTWQICNNQSFSWAYRNTADFPTNASRAIYILNEHNIRVTADVTVDQMTIEPGGSVTVDSGVTWTIANGAGDDLTINGSLTVNGTMKITGQLACNGTFSSAADSTVDYNSAANQTVCAYTYGNLTMSVANNPRSRTLAGNVTVLGDLTIGQSTTLDVDNHDITVAGDWINNGTFLMRTGATTFNGSAAQTIGGASSTSFYRLTINNTSADSEGVTLANHQTVANRLTLTDGLLKVASYDLTLGNNATVEGGQSANSMVVTDEGGSQAGRLCKVWSQQSSAAFTYPVGDTRGITQYTPITFTPASASGSLTVCFRVVDDVNSNLPSAVNSYLSRYWVGDKSGNFGSSYEISAAFDNDGDDSDVTGAGGMLPKRWDGGFPWIEGGAIGPSTFTWGGQTGGLNKSSEFTAFDIGVLAAALADFSAAQMGDHVLVTWETVSELDIRGFNLYRGTSADGPDVQLNDALIPAQSQGSPEGFTYTYEDRRDLVSGTTYWYWLEDLDMSGVLTRHDPVAIEYQGAPSAVALSGYRASAAATLPALTGLGLVALAGLAGLALRRRNA